MPPAISISSDDPADAGDHRLVPFLEIDSRRGARLRSAPRRQRARVVAATTRSASAFSARADQRAERADHRENAGDVALVEGVDRDVAADQFGGDVGLQVGERQHQIGLEREDLFDVGAR